MMLPPADIERFRERLVAQRDAVRQRIVVLERRLALPDAAAGAVSDRGDDATLEADHEQALDELALSRAELRQVEKALARIATGTYGISEVSGRPIPRERLEALPSATTLVDEPTRE